MFERQISATARVLDVYCRAESKSAQRYTFNKPVGSVAKRVGLTVRFWFNSHRENRVVVPLDEALYGTISACLLRTSSKINERQVDKSIGILGMGTNFPTNFLTFLVGSGSFSIFP